MEPSNIKIFSRYIDKLHVYSGLISSVYLLIVGVSVLNFQHKFLPEKETEISEYTQEISFDSSLKIDTLAKYISSQLNIKGHLPPWDYRQDKTGMVKFKIHRPARIYEVSLNRHSNLIQVREIHFSIGRILRAMHFGSIKNKLGDPMLDIWAYFAQISALSAFIAIITSLMIWFKRSVKSRAEWIIIILSGIFSLTFIFYIWLVG